MCETIQTLCRDILLLILDECDWRRMLALSQTCQQFLSLCELAWPRFYKTTFDRTSPSPKQDFKRLLLSTGTLTRYNIYSEKIEQLPVHYIKKIVMLAPGTVTINAHDECIFRGALISTDVLDIAGCSDTLYVLTKTEFYELRFPSKERIFSVPITDGKRIVSLGFCETQDGRIKCCIHIGGMHRPVVHLYDTTDAYHMRYRIREVWLDVPKHRIIKLPSNTTAVLDKQVYITDPSNQVVTTIPFQAEYGTFGYHCFLLVGKNGQLVSVVSQETFTVLDEKLLVLPIVHEMDGWAYYIRRSL